MIHRQGIGTDLAMAIVAFTPLKLGAPPFSLPQFPRLGAFAPHVLRIWIQVKPFASHGVPLSVRRLRQGQQAEALCEP